MADRLAEPCGQLKPLNGPAFDPNYDTAPLSFFEPMVMKLFEKPKNSIYKKDYD